MALTASKAAALDELKRDIGRSLCDLPGGLGRSTHTSISVDELSAAALDVKTLNTLMDNLYQKSHLPYQYSINDQVGRRSKTWWESRYLLEDPYYNDPKRYYARVCAQCQNIDQFQRKEGEVIPHGRYICGSCKKRDEQEKEEIRLAERRIAERIEQHRKNLYRVFWNIANRKGNHPWKSYATTSKNISDSTLRGAA